MISAVRLAFGFVWRSSRAALLGGIALQGLGAVALLALLLAVRELVAGLEATSTMGEITPWVLVVSAAFVVTGVVRVGAQSLQLLMAEQMARDVQRDITHIAASVPYRRYEEPEFHDLLERTTQRTGTSSLRTISGVSTIVESVAAMAAVAIALFSTIPALLPP